MDPDSYQKAWQSQSSQMRVTVAADLLLREVQRSERTFRATIFCRDFREVAIGLVMLPFWFGMGHWLSLPWTWYLGVPAITWVILFILVDRFRHKQQPTEPGEPLVDCVKLSLTQVEHQIWLLRNVFWWYLLPFSIAILAFWVQVTWLRSSGFFSFLLVLVPYALFLVILYGFIYYLNQSAVRRDLEPRRQELLTLLASLRDETAGEQSLASDFEHKTSGLWQSLLVTVLCAVVVIPMFLAARLLESIDVPPLIGNREVESPFTNLNADLRREKKLVGLATMVAVDGTVVASAVDGERKTGSGVPLEIGDQWHLGAIAQSITATTIARLIESGQLNWSTTMGEVFPDASIQDDWKPVTFKELLTNTAGAPANFPKGVAAKRPAQGAESTSARRRAVLDVLAKKPAYRPGEKHEYSNVSHTIAAAMAEQVTGQTWEDLVKREVFEPLALTSAGFGPPKSPDETLPQPRGHLSTRGFKTAVNDKADNTFIIGPAAAVHMSLADLCAYATEHLRGERGEGQLLSAETYRLLHAPVFGRYACGWVRDERTNAIPHTVYWHNGGNKLWYALVAIIPERNMVVAVSSNDGDFMSGEAAAWEIVNFAVKDFSAEAQSQENSELSPE